MKRLMFGMMLMATLVTGADGWGESRTVPQLLHYQASVSDESGKILDDGPVEVLFRLTDTSDRLLYEERQTLEVSNGHIAAMIGNGHDPSTGAAMGGIPPEALSPEGSKFLAVEVDGLRPPMPMEIVSVPYALYARESLSVADGAVGSATIADGSIAVHHFAEGALADIATALVNDRLIDTSAGARQMRLDLSAASGAAGIGVASGLVYSAKSDLQGVLRDIDRAVDMRQANIDREATLRGQGDAVLQTGLNGETTARVAADGTLQRNIDAEAATRGQAINSINTTLSDINNIPGVLQQSKIDGSLLQQITDIGRRVTDIEVDDSPPPPPPGPQIRAWGRVFPEMGGGVTLRGNGNVTSVGRSGNVFTITFTSPVSSDNYAISLTPHRTVIDSFGNTVAAPFTIDTITTGGFRVNFAGGASPPEFSFTIVQ